MPAAWKDDLDLGIDPEHAYETEHWRPSADYPEITTHRLRRAGDELEVRQEPPYGAPSVRRAKIEKVWRHVLRAELRFQGEGRSVHFDLVEKRVVELPDTFRAPVPVLRDPLDVGLWLELFAVLGEEAPRLYPTIAPRVITRAELEALEWTERSGERTATARWAAPSDVPPKDTSWIAKHFGQSPPAPPPPGYGLTRHSLPATERVELWLAEGSSPLFSLAMWAPRDGSAPTAMATGYFNPGLAALDAAIGRLGAVLAGPR